MEHQGPALHRLFDVPDALVVNLHFALVKAMLGSHGDGQGIAAAFLEEAGGLLRQGVGVTRGVPLLAANEAQLRLHRDVQAVGRPCHLPHRRHVLREGAQGGVHHNGGPAVPQATHIQGQVLAVVQVEHHRHLGPLGRPHADVPQVLKASIVDGVLAGLDNNRGLELLRGGNDGLEMLHIDIVDGREGVIPFRCDAKCLNPGNQHVLLLLFFGDAVDNRAHGGADENIHHPHNGVGDQGKNQEAAVRGGNMNPHHIGEDGGDGGGQHQDGQNHNGVFGGKGDGPLGDVGAAQDVVGDTGGPLVVGELLGEDGGSQGDNQGRGDAGGGNTGHEGGVARCR